MDLEIHMTILLILSTPDDQNFKHLMTLLTSVNLIFTKNFKHLSSL
jgi:hypothetical protein